jgi:cytochrome P450
MSLINLLELPVTVRRFFLPRFRQFESAFRQLDEIIHQMIAERRASGEDTGDFLSMLLTGRDDEHGETMDEAQLRDEVMGAFLAGHETTAIALTWAFYLLSKNPVARRQLQAEVRSVLGGRFPTMQDLPNLKFNRMVIEESMRLYPPAWGFDRKSLADDELGGYRIRAGSTVAICTYVMHHHPAYWENPEGFDPMRFSEERSAGRPEYAYLPFGGGPRRCIGNRFAMLEMQLIMAAMAQNFELDLVPGPPVNVRPTVNLQPDRNFPMKVKDLARA